MQKVHSCRGTVRGTSPPEETEATAITDPLTAAVDVEGIEHTIYASAFGDFYRYAAVLSLLQCTSLHTPVVTLLQLRSAAPHHHCEHGKSCHLLGQSDSARSD